MELPSRLIGEIDNGIPGPLICCIGGLHGNEPAGVEALEYVFGLLKPVQHLLRGRLAGLRGNRQALAVRRRYLHRDLNRLWTAEQLQAVRQLPPEQLEYEFAELAGLSACLERLEAVPCRSRVLLDLHTTSAAGAAFAIVSDRSGNQQLAAALHAPVIFNLTNALSSTLNVYADRRGWTGLAFEAGQHDDPEAVQNHIAAVCLLLARCGALDPEDIPGYAQHEARMIRAARHIPPALEVVYRHAIRPEDQFRMRPGYTNFDPVHAGEPLGQDRGGDVLAPYTGLIFMPLYQPQGEEGFFVVQEKHAG
ncbi:MAG: succinylglutamate desuccinylase/aspartoacylase family protein [Bacteroidia bacterium]|nr:succinylglutamate desuccinylase/aspartoacylase family protein [Bacteroidia bacterium]